VYRDGRMVDSTQTYSATDVKRFTRRLTIPLASTDTPPVGLEALVGKGFHLLLRGSDGRLLHVVVEPASPDNRAPIQTDHAALSFRSRGTLTATEQTWLRGLRRGLHHAERQEGWGEFLRWAAVQPAAMLPDATYDPDRDAAPGNFDLIRVETRCNGRCGFCSARGILPDLVLDAEQIARRLRAMRRRGRTNVGLTGGEATLRADLVDIVAQAQREGFSAISLQTNAMQLDRGPLLDRLVAAGLTSLFVPFLSHREEVHDDLIGVKGALRRTVAGVDRARSAGLDVGYNTVITTRNLQDLAPLMTWLAERFPAPVIQGNISYVALQGWTLDHPELVPPLSDVRPHLRRALDVCAERDLKITVPGLCGLPMCILPGYEHWFEEFHRGFGELPNNRSYATVCESCPLRGRCSGFWTAYFERFGEDELGYPAGVQPPV